MDGNSVLFGGSEGESRRRAISNISKIVTNLRNNTRNGHPTRAESAGIYEVRHGGFMLPHERRRVARSDPYPPHFEDYIEHSNSRRHQWRKGRRFPKRTFITRTTQSADPSSVVTWQPDEISGVTPFVHWASEERILEPFSRSAPRRNSIIADDSMASDSHQSSLSRTTSPRSSSSTQQRFNQRSQQPIVAPPSTPRNHDPASPIQSQELTPMQHEDPASGISNGGYASSCDGDSGERNEQVVYAHHSEVSQLRAEIKALKRMQEHNYVLLNSSLQEHFLTTGALENRLDKMSNAQLDLPGTTSTMLMWTVLDAVSAVILWLITVVIAKPYDAVRRNFRRDSIEDTSISRKSWRLDSGNWDCTSHDLGPLSRNSWRMDPKEAEVTSFKLSQARRLSVAVDK